MQISPEETPKTPKYPSLAQAVTLVAAATALTACDDRESGQRLPGEPPPIEREPEVLAPEVLSGLIASPAPERPSINRRPGPATPGVFVIPETRDNKQPSTPSHAEQGLPGRYLLPDKNN
jgi:hypothetical protein